jgi:hypothetical protein
MNATTDNTLLFSAADVATSIGVEIYNLRDLEPIGFGSPGHWRTIKTGGVVYTERGVVMLEEELIRLGKTEPAAALHALLTRERQAHEVPSRGLIADDTRHAWQNRADCS